MVAATKFVNGLLSCKQFVTGILIQLQFRLDCFSTPSSIILHAECFSVNQHTLGISH